jgi:sulfur relay (sulfurtransferase) complex TusBCD TusD component (DsrE family)
MANAAETRLAILLSRGPACADSRWALAIAGEAGARGVPTELFLMADGAELLRDEWVGRLDLRGVRVTVCTQTVAQRGLPTDVPDVDYAGQVQWGRMVRRADRVLAFS